jgi:hypothetical protein
MREYDEEIFSASHRPWYFYSIMAPDNLKRGIVRNIQADD